MYRESTQVGSRFHFPRCNICVVQPRCYYIDPGPKAVRFEKLIITCALYTYIRETGVLDINMIT